MASPKTTTHSLDDLYSLLQGEYGLDILEKKLKEWEFDIKCVIDDVGNPESDLKEHLPPLLFNKILSIVMNGSFSDKLKKPTTNTNKQNKQKLDPQIIKLSDRISKIIDATTAQKIMEKITDEEVLFDLCHISIYMILIINVM